MNFFLHLHTILHFTFAKKQREGVFAKGKHEVFQWVFSKRRNSKPVRPKSSATNIYRALPEQLSLDGMFFRFILRECLVG